MTHLQRERDDLLRQRQVLRQALEDADNLRELKDASGELRQVNSALRDVEGRIAIEEADTGLAEEKDPAVIAEALLRDLPDLARTCPEVAAKVRDELCRVLPVKDGE